MVANTAFLVEIGPHDGPDDSPVVLVTTPDGDCEASRGPLNADLGPSPLSIEVRILTRGVRQFVLT